MCAILIPTCTVLAESELGSTEQSMLLITCTHINTSLLSAWLANMPDMVRSCQMLACHSFVLPPHAPFASAGKRPAEIRSSVLGAHKVKFPITRIA